MSKELEAFCKIKDFGSVGYTLEEYSELVNIIVKALQRLEQIDNAKTSEALECLENIGFAPLNECCGAPYTRIKDEYNEDFNIIKQALKRLEEIDQAKPNEALKCLTGLEKEITRRDGYISSFLKIKFDTIKVTLLKSQEQDFNYSKIVLPFFNELVTILGINDTDEMLDKIKEQEKLLDVIKEYVMPLVSVDDECVWDNEGYQYLVPKKEDLILLMRYICQNE